MIPMESCNTRACQSAREIFHELEEYYDDHNLYFQTIGSVLEAANALDVPLCCRPKRLRAKVTRWLQGQFNAT